MSEKISKKEVEKDIKTYKSIEAILNLDGGKLIVNKSKKEVVTTVDQIVSIYKTASHAELLSLCAKLEASLGLLKVFKNAKTNLELAEEALLEAEE